MATFGQWDYVCNREATVRAYLASDSGGVDSCQCSGCRNFVAVRERVFPDEFLRLLRSLGIDHRKDAEIYQIAQLSPGRHLYGGWFHFAGHLHNTGDFPTVEISPSFKVWMCKASAPHIAGFKSVPRVQLEIEASNVPWDLSEPEAP